MTDLATLLKAYFKHTDGVELDTIKFSDDENYTDYTFTISGRSGKWHYSREYLGAEIGEFLKDLLAWESNNV